MKLTDGGYFFELIFDISNVVGSLQVHLQESTGELDQNWTERILGKTVP